MSSKYHDVTYYQQNHYQACWFASLRMIVRWRFDQYFAPPNKTANSLYAAGYRTIAKKLFDTDYDMHWDTMKSGAQQEGALPLSMNPDVLLKVCEKLGMAARSLPAKESEQTDYIEKLKSMLNLSPILWPGLVKGYRGYEAAPAGMRNAAAPALHVAVIVGYERWQGYDWFLLNDPFIDPNEPEDEQGEIWMRGDDLWNFFPAKNVAIWQNPI